MAGIFEAIVEFFKLIANLINVFISMFVSLVEMVFMPLQILVKMDTSTTPAIPTFLITFVLFSVTIGVIFKIFGRRLGK